MRHHIFVAFSLLLLGIQCVTAQNGYLVELNLGSITNDRLQVTVHLPKLDKKEATFVFPVTAPGTYEYVAWHRLVHDFTAFDDKGLAIPVGRSVDSQYVISQADRVRRVTYWIDDSFDVADSSVMVFHPAGTDFEDSLVVLNHTGVVGYIDGMQARPYEVHVKHPSYMYCATALEVTKRSDTADVYTAPSYDALVDGPALFSVPDTTSFVINGTKILVALAHHNTEKLAPEYAKILSSVTSAIHKFLGVLPVDRYAFLLYLYNGDTVNIRYMHNAQGALEHNFSSLYFIGYSKRPLLLKDIAGHEFLHILVPLNLHSEEIGKFNFRTPEMSDHLWLYEGVTEYFAEQSLLRDSITTATSFIKNVEQWVISFQYLPDTFNLITFSRDVLTPENQSLYPLIYYYGPLNALLLDIVLRESSNGSIGLLELVQRLMKEFGQSKSFRDEDLFAEIGKNSTAEAQEYCAKYINGNGRLPVKDVLARIGVKYTDSIRTEKWTFGIHVDRRSNDSTFIIYPDTLNPLGIAAGDILLKLNGVNADIKSYDASAPLFRPVNDTVVKIVVERDGAQLELQSKPTRHTVTRRHVIELDTNATAEQTMLRNRVFFGKAN